MPETKTLIYEWDAEEWSGSVDDPAAECLEHDHRETFAEVLRAANWMEERGAHVRVVLVRDDTTDGGRSWAYLTNGVLPEFFTEPDINGAYQPNGIRVPKRFHDEVAKATREAAR